MPITEIESEAYLAKKRGHYSHYVCQRDAAQPHSPPSTLPERGSEDVWATLNDLKREQAELGEALAELLERLTPVMMPGERGHGIEGRPKRERAPSPMAEQLLDIIQRTHEQRCAVRTLLTHLDI